MFIYTPALPPSQMYGGSAPMPPLTVRPCGFPQSVVAPGEIKPPATAPGAAARICPATTPKRRQWRKQQGVVGAALQYLQGRKSRRKYWFSARDPAPQVGPQRGPRVRALPFKPFGCPSAEQQRQSAAWGKETRPSGKKGRVGGHLNKTALAYLFPRGLGYSSIPPAGFALHLAASNGKTA